MERKLYQPKAGRCTECHQTTEDERTMVILPTQLTLAVEDRRQQQGDRWKWPEVLDINGNVFKLVGLAIRVLPGHYTARVQLQGHWYEYDDLKSGHLQECLTAHDDQTSNRFIRAAVYVRAPQGQRYHSAKEFTEVDHAGVADVC